MATKTQTRDAATGATVAGAANARPPLTQDQRRPRSAAAARAAAAVAPATPAPVAAPDAAMYPRVMYKRAKVSAKAPHGYVDTLVKDEVAHAKAVEDGWLDTVDDCEIPHKVLHPRAVEDDEADADTEE